MLASCDGERITKPGDPEIEFRIVNSTGLSNVIVIVTEGATPRSGSWTGYTFFTPTQRPVVLGWFIRNVGDPVSFQVEAGGQTTDHVCHVHADTLGREDNIPTAVIYSQPLRIVCQRGWQEVEQP
ncbi:MAG: hypothetical protein ACT4PM_05140 [Gemmatimonadales bacterium]